MRFVLVNKSLHLLSKQNLSPLSDWRKKNNQKFLMEISINVQMKHAFYQN